METIDAKRKVVLERIASLQQSVRKATEYLESGKHADWHRFRPWFGRKRELPPHKDWVKNVFLPRLESALSRAGKALERLNEQERVRVRDDPTARQRRTRRAERSL